ncbi:hypothetical protein K443DRAFT_674227 [Laccaria amethystina LaAM-08-1]|uniref:Uncharacterized protein n=1 Tax=Laccaria amethystina LaAM-08-1 TaxID=1095629 RepID=A0A0C9XY68_9AGAR|nr:hypothetical protein K443DRAFT_674227 [Laccaria amethystina LaAM-08-1]
MPFAKEKAKHLAENLFNKIIDSLDKKDSPPPPPPKPPQVNYAAQPSDQNFVQSFNDLTLSNVPPPSISSAGEGFVGGFYPNLNVPRPPTFQHSASAPHMPSVYYYPPNVPQSITMQMALDDDTPLPSIRPHSTPQLPLSTSHLPSKSTSKPPKPIRKRSASTPPTPTDQNDQFRCAGVTKAGKRCVRIVKTGAALAQAIGDNQDQDSPALPRFCHQHQKEILEPSGYYSKKNGEFVNFDDWIPQYLQEETRASLRVEMGKSRSPSDVEGYIYTFEIREPSQNKTIKLKVGRAVNLVKRIDQWGKQCGSKEQILRGFYPGVVEPDEDGGEGSLMKGRVKAGEKAAWCHRLGECKCPDL